MNSVKCKRCDTPNLHWSQSFSGKWELLSESDSPHRCDDGMIKSVKCKYCTAEDLHWAEEINTVNQQKKMILTESYGLPHACDARIAFMAKEKQDKKDKYESEKKRIGAMPIGQCEACKGLISLLGFSCASCLGYGYFNDRNKKAMLAQIRVKLWPNMQSYITGRRY